jgi:glycosyltransferase involved in cell wall biosynthesis
MPRQLTVLICTHDRATLLERALASLDAAQRPEGWNVDILVIANACQDATADVLRRYQAISREGWLPLRYAEEPVPGKSRALNLAIGLLRAEAIAFVDDDHRVDPGYLVAACRALEGYPDADLLCGRIIPDWDGTEPQWVHDASEYRIYPLPVPRYDLGDAPVASPQDTATPGGGNWVLRRELLNRVGAFSVTYGPVGRELSGSEDKEWAWRALAAGARFQYVPDIMQYHYVDRERLRTGYVMRKAFERSASAVRVAAGASGGSAVPGYLWRKAATYLGQALTSLAAQRRRFYLVRLAAALGEIKGHLQVRGARGAQPRHSVP